MQCVILAGGLGTRMRSTVPGTAKSMISVAGKPFIAWQLEWLGAQGVDSVVLSIGYQGDQIQSYVKDGQGFDLRVRYVDEGDRLLGTAGALRLAADAGALDERFFVLYGDSYLDVSLEEVWRFFGRQNRAALMTVYRNDNEGEVSNVIFDGTIVTRYAKNLAKAPDDMMFVDYGLLLLARTLVEKLVDSNVEADLAILMEALSANGELAGYEATAKFFEIGSPEGLRELEDELRRVLGPAERSGSDDR
jgi:N-acetyl-alpha-D-muramate 1-phosphate uridylyltransferase